MDSSGRASLATTLGVEISKNLEAREEREPRIRTLYATQLGERCVRRLWYVLNAPEKSEKLEPSSKLKFIYGHTIEALVLALARAAGHSVSDRQRVCEARYGDWTVRGRIDGTIDGVLVDIKSCSSRAFNKMAAGLDDSSDAFGYRAQINFYMEALGHEEAYFILVDKVNGRIQDVKLEVDPGGTLRNVERLTHDKTLETSHNVPLLREYTPVPYGTSGNLALGIECAYCPFKRDCWSDANSGKGLREFRYKYGTEYFVEIKKEPQVKEILE